MKADRLHYRREIQELRQRAAATDEWESKYTETLRQYNELLRQYQAAQVTLQEGSHHNQQLDAQIQEQGRALEMANERRKEDEEYINQLTLDLQAYRRDTNALHRRVTELKLEMEEVRVRASYEPSRTPTNPRAHSPSPLAAEGHSFGSTSRPLRRVLALTYPPHTYGKSHSDTLRNSYSPPHHHTTRTEETPWARAPTLPHHNHGNREEEHPDDFYMPTRSQFDLPMNAPSRPRDQLREQPQNNQVTSEVSQVLGQIFNYLDKQKQTKNPQGYEEAVKAALKISHSITLLTTKALRQGDNKGVQALNKYLGEVEQRCPLESVRVALIPLTVESELLKRLKLDEEALKTTSWHHFKQLLSAKLPKVRPCDAETRILQMRMTRSDDIEEFISRIRKEYDETCQLLGVGELGTPLNEVLEVTVTGNMALEGKTMFGRALRRNPETAIGIIEEAFREKAYKDKMFISTNPSSSLAETRARPPGAGRPVAFAQPALMAQNQAMPLGSYAMNPAVTPQPQPQQPSNVHSSTGQATQPQRPFQETARGVGISSGREQREVDRPWAFKRKDQFGEWRDWVCITCNNINAGGFFTCSVSECKGQATDHQLPPESWQCKRSYEGRLCGQNTWTGDHFCYACLGPNPAISSSSLRILPANCKPRPRAEQTWYQNSPAIEP